MDDYHDSDPVEIILDGVLDLHTFHPGDVKELVPDYLAACREEQVLTVCIIHGKGTGVLRQIVHSCLDKLDYVAAYRLAGDHRSWGATVVELLPPD